MIKKIHLWWLRRQLKKELGKHNMFLNRVHDEQDPPLDRQIEIANEIIALPPLQLSQRHREYVRLKNWQG